MKNNLHRLFSHLLEIPQPKLSSSLYPPYLSASITSTTKHFTTSSHPENPKSTEDKNPSNDEPKIIAAEGVDVETPSDDEDSDLVMVDGKIVNKKTGEIGGPRGPEPTRYGDWEQKGRCSNF